MDIYNDLFKINYNAGDLRPIHDAVSAILREGNKILMMDHVKFNFWTIPIGKVEPRQTVVAGLRQEMKEELNITPINFSELGKFTKKYKREKIVVTIISHIFMIDSWGGTIRNNEPKKHRSIKWMTLDEIEKLKRMKKLSDSTIEAIKYI